MRKSKFLAFLFVFAMVAAACSSDDDGSDTTVGAGGGDDTTATADLAGQSVTVMAKWGETGGEGEAFLEVIKGFEAATGASVTYEGVGDDLPTILSTRVAGGDPPDVAILPQPGLLVDLATQGSLVPIEDAAGDELDASFAPVWRDLGSVDGTLYGVFFKGANKSTVWYDVAAFDANGIDPPTTWDEWLAAAEDFVDAGITPIAVGGADGWTLTDWFENVYLRTAGPEKYDQLTNHEIAWTDQSVKDALATLGELIGVEANVADGLNGALQIAFGDSVKKVFADGDAAMVYEGDFVAGVITAETGAAAGSFNFFDFPSIDGSPPAVVGGGDVAVALSDSAVAMAFVEYLATAEAGEIWAPRGGFSSPNQDVDTSLYPDEISAAAAAGLANAEVFRFDLSDLVPSQFGGTAGAGLFGGLQNWLGNPADIDGVTSQLEAEAAAAFGG